jgi:hypothetical protein
VGTRWGGWQRRVPKRPAQRHPHLAGRLYDVLADRIGPRVFMDIDSIAPGRDFAVAIEKAVGGSGIMLAPIGTGWSAPSTSAGTASSMTRTTQWCWSRPRPCAGRPRLGSLTPLSAKVRL